MSFIAVFFITFIIVFIAVIGFEYQRHKKSKQRFESIRMITDASDIDRFISEIDEDIEKTNNTEHVKLLLVSKSTGLFYKGEWIATITLLESIDPSPMPREFRAVYYTNLMASKLFLGDVDAAYKLYTGHLVSLAPYITNQDVNANMGIMIGALEYCIGEIPKCKLLFEYVLEMIQLPLPRAVSHYFLAFIATHEENQLKAIEHFDEAIIAGTDTWISESARDYAIALKNS